MPVSKLRKKRKKTPKAKGLDVKKFNKMLDQLEKAEQDAIAKLNNDEEKKNG